MRGFILLGVSAALTMLLFSFSVKAEDIAICGESDGYSYYPKAGLGASSSDAGKWHSDGMSGGRLTATRTDDGAFDIISLDAAGRMFSYKGDGAMVVQTANSEESLTLVVFYPGGNVETYIFLHTADGQSEVMWTANKVGLLPKVAAFRAPCSYLKY